MSTSRPNAYEIPSEKLALHFARALTRLEDAMRPRICRECLARIEPWLEYEVADSDSPRATSRELCRRCANEAA